MAPSDDDKLAKATDRMCALLRARWPSYVTSYVHDIVCHIPEEIAADRLYGLASGQCGAQAAEHLNKIVSNAWLHHTNKHLLSKHTDNAVVQVLHRQRSGVFGLRELSHTEVSLMATV